MSNVYYNPEQCGLNLVGVLDDAKLSYEFDTLIVLEATQDGKLYWARDSGCSCPTPFEDYRFGNGETNLEELNKETLSQFITSVDSFPASPDERRDLIRKVEDRLKK